MSSNKTKESLTKSSSKVAAAAAKVEQPELVEEGESKQIDFPFNDRTYESYKKHGLEVPRQIELSQEKIFLSLANIEEGRKIERVVTRIIRTKERDYSTGNKVTYREYIWYTENWFGQDWLGQDSVPPVSDHIEGYYMEQLVSVTRERDLKTGQLGPAKTKRTGERPIFYIPFSKKAVEEIVGDQDPAGIVFTIKFGGNIANPADRGLRNNFTYQQLTDLSMEEAFKLNALPSGPLYNRNTAASLKFEPR
jgi:hypothetical protein